ncbi:hypothetical protein PI87_24250 [Ralstonia sp. A12]|nr:hypothetical protein PI87_24250 [Ralstonia sp. A12]
MLRLDRHPPVEVHCCVPDGQDRWLRLIADRNLRKMPPAVPGVPPVVRQCGWLSRVPLLLKIEGDIRRAQRQSN